MSSIHKDITINAPAAEVWDALRDVGRPHERITPGVLTDSSLDGDIRTVTFANGLVARERIVDVDDQNRRVAYAVVNGPFEHHHASMQVVEDGPDVSHIVWITDLLPAEIVPMVSELVDAGSQAMQMTLENEAVATLVTIGDFSKMTYLTVKALRHYHDIGLLEPVSIDEQNGYRLYGTDQVAVAQTIRRFRELDMPTDEIKSVLEADDDATRNAVIVAHLDRMEEQLEQTRGTVTGLRMLLDGGVDDPTVAYRTLVPTLAVAIREAVQFDGAESWCEQAYAELHALLDGRGAVADGPDGALYDGAFFEDGEGVVTAFVPVRGDLPTTGRVVQVEIPGFDAAVAVHTGAFDDLDQTYRALGTRVVEQGIGAVGPMREHYLADDTIEVCWPVTRRP